MKEIIDYIKRQGGYARMSELRSAGFQTRDISILCEQGSLEKVKAGLYKLSNSEVTSGYVDVSKAIPEAVIAVASAFLFMSLPHLIHQRFILQYPMRPSPKKLISPRLKCTIFERHSMSLG